MNIRTATVTEVMTGTFKSVSAGALASEAARVMQYNEIYSLVVLHHDHSLAGVITMHDLLKANVV